MCCSASVLGSRILRLVPRARPSQPRAHFERLCTLCEPASAADDVPRRLHERASSFRPLHPGECASVPLRAAEHRVTVQEGPAHEREDEREAEHDPARLMREGIADDKEATDTRQDDDVLHVPQLCLTQLSQCTVRRRASDEV